MRGGGGVLWVAASRYISEGFFSKGLSRERWRLLFLLRGRWGGEKKRLSAQTFWWRDNRQPYKAESLIDAATHTRSDTQKHKHVHIQQRVAPSYRSRARVVQHSKGNWTEVAMETGETVAGGRSCALGASDLPSLNTHTACMHSTHTLPCSL